MKKNYFLLICSIVFSLASLAQPQWQWIKTGGGTKALNNFDIAYAFAKDASNNIFSCGVFNGSNTAIGTGTYSTGVYTNSRNAYVTKKDINGNPIWQFIPTSSISAYAYNITIDSNGDAIVCGQYEGTLTAGLTTLTAGSGTNSAFIIKINGTTGAVIWAKSFKSAGSGSSDVAAYGITTYTDGSIYVCGSYSGSGLTFNDVTTYASTTNSSGTLQTDGYLVKLNSLGATQWVRRTLGNNNSAGNYDKLMYDVVLNSGGNPLTVGYFRSKQITMYPGTNSVLNTNTNGGSYDGFIAFWSSNGGNLGITKIGSTSSASNDYLFGITQLPNNEFGVCGQFSNVASIKKINGNSLNVISTIEPTNAMTSAFYSLDSDASGNIYATGTITNNGTFGSTTLAPVGYIQDNLLAKVTTSNTWGWAINYGSVKTTVDNDYGRSICVINTDDLIVGGAFSDTMTVGTFTTYAKGNGDFYEARYAPCGSSMAFVNQPSNAVTCVNSNANFSVTTSESATYTWYKNGNIVNNVTSNTYSPTVSALDDGATIYCVANGVCGTATSSTATISFPQTPSITGQPIASQTICLGNSATMAVSASGNSLQYQWLKNGSVISGQTSSTFTINSVNSNDNATYTVRVSNSCGTNIVSTGSVLTVLGAPTISTQPSSTAICVANNLTLTVVSPDANVTYQWKKNNSNINGETNSSLTISNATLNDAGNYNVVVSNNSCGATISSTAFIGVFSTTTITSQPTDASGCEYTSNALSISATGANLSYSWTKDGLPINGAISNTLNFNSLSANDNGVYVAYISGTCGNVISNSVTVTSVQATYISTITSSASKCAGTSLSVNPMVLGNNLTFQWNFNGTPINGATNNNLIINSLTTQHQGSFTLSVNGTCGNVVSNGYNLTINTATASTLTEVSCGDYSLNGQTYTQSGTYTQTIPNAKGCDSVIILNLTIPVVDFSATLNATTLTASNSNATYQWINCDTKTSISNATQQTFTPTTTGNYAAIVTSNNCSDTSNCFLVNINNVGLNSIEINTKAFQVYPNPTNGEVTLISNEPAVFSITNVVGDELFQVNSNGKSNLDLSTYSNGIYFIKNIDSNQFIRIVKQ